MTCHIEWNTLSLEDWQSRFAALRRATLLQSYDYARAVCPLNRQKARWGLIKINGQEAGLVQILEAGILKNALHGFVLDLGPLWFDGWGTEDNIRDFFTELNRIFPRRPGRRRRIIPAVANTLDGLGYKQLERPGYQTIWMNLDNDMETLRTQMKRNWRNKLNKAERKGLKIEWDEKNETFSWLLRNYQSDKFKKGYDGPSPHILQALVRTFGASGHALIGRAMLGSHPVAAILILVHGAAATYQVGWTSDQGRETAAHHLLLWDAVRILKSKGIRDFDLGGINDESAKGVKQFKEGFGGETVTLSGHYM